MKQQATAAPKKPYKAPKLLVYGSLTEMTQSSSNKVTHMPDGATTGKKRT
jgi:hypothetical protein